MGYAGRALAALALVLGVAGRARPDFVIYHHQADFLAHTASGYFLNTFPRADGVMPSPLSFSQGDFAYTAAVALDGFFSKPDQLSTNSPFTPIVFTFAGKGVTAAGGDFWLTDTPFGAAPGTLTVGLAGGRTFDLSDATAATFLGFTSDTPITSLTLTPHHQKSSAYATAGDFIVGKVQVAVDTAPEPATFVPACLGLAAVGVSLWRRRRRAAVAPS